MKPVQESQKRCTDVHLGPRTLTISNNNSNNKDDNNDDDKSKGYKED